MNMIGRSQRGTALLTVTFCILPMLLLLFSVSMDISGYYLETRLRQRAIDEITLQAYRYLPYTQRAEAVVQDLLRQRPELAGQTQIEITPDSVTLTHEGKVPLHLASLFGALLGNSSLDQGLTVTALSRSVGTPYDTLLLLDTSGLLAPELPFGTPWGSALDYPTATFLASNYPPQYALGPSGTPSQIDPRLLTQQCFNPVFTTLKLSLIRTYEYLSSFGLNAVGVGVFPGSGAYVDYIRDVRPTPSIGEASDAHFPAYLGLYIGDSHCAAAAETELSNRNYRFPESSSEMTGLWQPPGGGGIMVDPHTFEYNLNYAPFLSVSQSVWSQAAKSGFLPDTARVIEAVRADTVGSVTVAARAGLSRRQVRSAVVFAGDVPRIGGLSFPDPAVQLGLTQEIDLLKADIQNYGFYFQLYYVLYEHPGNTLGFAGKVQQLKNFFSQAETIGGLQEAYFRIHLVHGSNLSELESQVTALLAMDKRRGVLAR